MERGQGITGRIGRAARRFAADETGATAIEYGLIAALIGVFIIGAMRTLGFQLSSTFRTVRTYLQ